MSCASIPLNDGAVAARGRPPKKRPPKPQRPAPPPVDVRRLVAVSVPSPWHVLLALGLCPALCLPASERILWAEYVALHVTEGPEDARAFALAREAGVEVPEHPLRSVRQAVVSVLRVERPRFLSPGLGRAVTPWFHGATLLHVKDALVLHAIPWSADVPGLASWDPGDELRHDVRRALKAALAARAHLEAEQKEESLHAERAGKMGTELDVLLDARVCDERTAPPPRPAKPLARVVVTSVDHAAGTFAVRLVAPVPDPLAELQRRYEEGQRRLNAIALEYRGYHRSATAMCPVTGLKGYLCPKCQDWFTWSPGVQPHACGSAA